MPGILELIGGGAGVAAVAAAIGAVLQRWLASRTADRKAALDHDSQVAPSLLDRIAILEAREGRYEAELGEVRERTEDCERRHTEAAAQLRAIDGERTHCQRDLAAVRARVEALEMQAQEVASVGRTVRPTPPSERSPVSGRTVLVVDDEADTRASLARLLDSLGHRTLVAADAREALALLAADRRIDLVLADWRMPGADGVELVRSMRRARHRQAAILVTGATRDEVPDIGVSVLRKPVTREQLASAIAGALEDTGRFRAIE